MSPPFELETFLAGASGGRTVTYQDREIAYAQNEKASSVFYIWEGQIKLTVLSARGKEAIIAVAGPRDFVGEACLNGQTRRAATAVALGECKVTKMSKQTMTGLLRKEPRFSEKFVSYLLARNIRIEADLVDQLFNSSERRLARMLLLLANFGREGKPKPLLARISQETLAEMIGATRSQVSQLMNKFRNLGLISYNGRIEVHTSLLDSLLHDDPHIKLRKSAAPER